MSSAVLPRLALRGVLSAVVLLFVTGCFPPVTIPIETIRYDSPDNGPAKILFVFLPGRGDPITVFQNKGLVEAVRHHGLSADMIAVNAHIGYYLSGTVFTRLKKDVITPARARGYEQIWLVGNSLGGYGSLSYDREYPNDITGVVLLGPYLGRKDVIDEIKDAGGLSRWKPELPGEKDWELHWEKKLWLWLRDRTQQEEFWLWAEECEQQGCNPKVFLGYGRSDRFSYGQAFLASLMPPQHVIAIDGGHDWKTWTRLWNLFLDRNIFSRKPRAGEAPREAVK